MEGMVILCSVGHHKATSCWLSTERLRVYLGSPLTLKHWSDYGPAIGSSRFNCFEDTALFCSRMLKMWFSFLKFHSGSDARYPAAVQVFCQSCMRHLWDIYQRYLLLWALPLMTEKLWTFGSAAQGHSWLLAAQIGYNNHELAITQPQFFLRLRKDITSVAVFVISFTLCNTWVCDLLP